MTASSFAAMRKRLSTACCAALACGSAALANEGWPTADAIPPGTMIIDGDLVVPTDYWERRASFDIALWANGVVPYTFDPEVSIGNRAAMRSAMDQWQTVAGVSFVERSNQSDYLYIQNATFNASEGVGPSGGRHEIWITSWSSNDTLLHELGHALAYWHEQSRVDRDLSIRVEWANISQTACDGTCSPQFATRPSPGGEYGPYDFESVMHCSQCAFSCRKLVDSCRPDSACPAADCRTITTLDPMMQDVIGRGEGLSFFDAFVMRGLYPFPSDRFYDREFPSNGAGTSLLSPFDAFDSFLDAYLATPDGGTLFVLRPGAHHVGNGASGRVFSLPRVLAAPLGGVVLVQ